MSSEKISFDQGKIVVHKQPIRDELKNKLSEEDIELSEQLITGVRQKRHLLYNLIVGKSCDGCQELKSDYKTKCENKAAPYGNMNSPIMFVNRVPSVLECGTMISHSDTAGYFLTLIMKKLGYDPDDFYYTNFVKCPSPKISADDCWKCATSYFMKEVNLIKPKVLVCEGLSLLKVLKDANIFLNLPETLEYGMVYDSYFVTEKTPMKIVSIYDLDMVLQKTGDDLQQCKNTLWAQLSKIASLVKN